MTRPLAQSGPMNFADSLPQRTALHPARKVNNKHSNKSFFIIIILNQETLD